MTNEYTRKFNAIDVSAQQEKTADKVVAKRKAEGDKKVDRKEVLDNMRTGTHVTATPLVSGGNAERKPEHRTDKVDANNSDVVNKNEGAKKDDTPRPTETALANKTDANKTDSSNQ